MYGITLCGLAAWRDPMAFKARTRPEVTTDDAIPLPPLLCVSRPSAALRISGNKMWHLTVGSAEADQRRHLRKLRCSAG